MKEIKWAALLCRVLPWNRPAAPALSTSTTTCMERVCFAYASACVQPLKWHALVLFVCEYISACTLYIVTDIAELNVVLKEGPRTTTLWWLSGSHADLWHHGEVTVGRMPQDFTILFEASRTFTKPGHIAIDDIDFTNCTLPGRPHALYTLHHDFQLAPFSFFFRADLHSWFFLFVSFTEPQLCPENMFMCNNSVCVEPNRVCDFSDDCGDRSDENNCGEISQMLNC